MKACVNTFRLPKAGHTDSENEDYCWPLQSCEERLPVRVAVADGATDAVYSGLWARLLVKSYCKHRINGNFIDTVNNGGRVWRRIVRDHSLPWYVEEKARAGTFAAFMGVSFVQTADSNIGTWTATACGDCCLFQLRGPQLLTAFPITRAVDFTNAPVLLRTHAMSGEDSKGIRTLEGTWQEEDSFYLMSDALACWFLSACESGAMPWQILNDVTLAGHPEFSTWIGQLRDRHELKNDDCTLVSVTFE